jgi:hypothetical protein
MIIIPMIVILVLAAYAASSAGPGFVRTVLYFGMALAVGAWLPLLLGILLDPDGRVIGNALGLGLLAWGGSALGFVVVLVGLALRGLQLLR